MSVEWCRLAPLAHTLRWLLAPVLGFGLVIAASLASAQSLGLVVRDGTLGSAPAGVVAPGPDDLGTANYLIRADLGEQRGGNLFHSFESFSIGSGERATFTADGAPNPGAIDNVISRVTGRDPSQVDGVLHSTIPGADVWLLNPRGVVFGAGAQLDVPASFRASTGDYVGFGTDGLERFYSNKSLTSVLSTARPTAFGFLGEHATGSLSLDHATLAVADAETLELVAGDVSLTRTTLDASGATPGTISIRGGKIVIEDHSQVLAENESPMPPDPEAAKYPGPGLISLDASESVLVDNGLLSVRTNGAGNAGTIDMASPSVTFQNGLGILAPERPDVGAAAETFGTGRAGTIHIDAQTLIVQDGAALSAFAFGGSAGEASGNAGTIEIDADSLELSDRSFIGVAALGNATDAGTIDIDLGDDGSLHAFGVVRADGEFGYAWIVAGTFPQFTRFTPTGTGGEIAISTGSLLLDVGAQINVPTLGDGDAGGITIHAADSVTISNGALIGANTSGKGVGGTIEVDAGVLELRDGGEIRAATEGTAPDAGKGGTITVDAHRVTIGSRGRISTETTGAGRAGNIDLEVDTLAIETRGFINASDRSGGGGAGAIKVTATDSIFMTNEGGDPFDLDRLLDNDPDFSLSGIFSSTVEGGNGGSITLNAPEITVTHGAIVATSTIGGGQGGDIDLSGDRIHIVNGGFVDTTSAPLLRDGVPISGGQAGSLKLAASESIEVGGSSAFGQVAIPGDPSSTLPSRVASEGLGTGKAGNVTLEAPRIELFGGGTIATDSLTADGGNIEIRAEKLVHLDRGVITAAVKDGVGGNIAIDPEIVLLEHGSRIVADAGNGDGGNIQITADNYFAFPGTVVDASSDFGLDGVVEVHAPDVDLAGNLTALPANYLDASSLLRERCAARASGERAGSFAVRGAGGIPPEPDGWLRASVSPDAAATAAATGPPALVASLPGPLLAEGTCE